MLHPTLPASRSQASEPVPGHILRGRDLLHSGVWRLCTRHLAISTIHGHYDMRRVNSITNTGKFTFIHYSIASQVRLPFLNSVNLNIFSLTFCIFTQLTSKYIFTAVVSYCGV
jgi:hypothetical protein